jgi:hypothetical protein
LTLGSFSDAAPLFGNDTKQLGMTQFIGITTFPTTPTLAPRQMPPLAYPQQQQQPKQSSSSFNNSNGITSSSQSLVNNNRTYNNNNNTINNNNNNNINNTAINNVNSYQPQKSSSSGLLLAPPPQSRVNSGSSSSINSSSSNNNNNNTFARPSDNKPLINGRSAYAIGSQLNKHEVSVEVLSISVIRFFSSCCRHISLSLSHYLCC